MKECPNCKAKNQDRDAFCASCGTSLKDVPSQADEFAAAAGEFLNKAKDAAAMGARKAKEAAQTGAERAQQAVNDMEKKTAGFGGGAVSDSSFLVDPSEQVISTIGSSYLQNYLSGGGMRKGVGVLTDRRFYYKGKNFSGKGTHAASTTTEGVVALEDVTYTEFNHTRRIGFLIAGILLLMMYLMVGFAAGDVSELGGIMTFCLIVALALIVAFFLLRQTLFTVCFAGGYFSFDVRYYPIADFQDFQRQLHLLKDRRKEKAAV